MRSKKGLSQVIGTLLMVLVTLGLIAGLWGPIQSFVTDKVDHTESCMGNFNQITLNNEYTCFNATANETYVSISRKTMEIDSLLISVTYSTDSFLFRVENGSNKIANVTNYRDWNEAIEMPKAGAGKTYRIHRTGRPLKISVAPKVGDEQCDVIASTNEITRCI